MTACKERAKKDRQNHFRKPSEKKRRLISECANRCMRNISFTGNKGKRRCKSRQRNREKQSSFLPNIRKKCQRISFLVRRRNSSPYFKRRDCSMLWKSIKPRKEALVSTKSRRV